MKMFRLIRHGSAFALLALSLGGLLPAHAAPTAERPNIIVILADDWGIGDIKCYGGERSKIDTPNMDKLASRGMAFTDAHSASAVCTPSRYSLLTGRYNWRSRLKSSVLFGFDAPLIDTDRATVASMLAKQGYRTACFGKWHLGMNMPTTDGKPANSTAKTPEELATKCNIDWKGKITGGPTAVGFDEFWGISASLDMPPYIWIHDDRFVGECTTLKRWGRRGPAEKNFEAVDVLPTLTKKATDYVATQAKSDKPFFLYLPLNSPHTPHVPSEAFAGKSGLGTYADYVMETDWAVGKVVDAVDAARIADHTLIIVTADNGCSGAAQRDMKSVEFTGDKGLSQDMSRHYPSFIYRGLKADIYEGGHRVPFIARWDGRIKAGGRSDQTICLVDLFATFADIVGVKCDDKTAEDSVSILSALKGTATGPLRKSLVSHSFDGNFALREGPWKLEFCPGSGSWNPTATKIFMKGPPPAHWLQLFNLADDPSEQRNLVDKDKERVDRMTAEMRKFIEEGRSTPGKPQANDGDATHLFPNWMRQRMK